MQHQPLRPPIHRQRWLVVVGLLLIVLGLVAVSVSTAVENVVALVMAVLLMAAALIQLGLAVLTFNWRHGLLHFGAAAADVLIGFLLLGNPRDAPFAIESLLVLFLAFGGIHPYRRLALAPAIGLAWLFGTGIAALLLAMYVWIERPGLIHRGLWLIAACVVLDFALHGVSWIMVSRALPPGSAELPPTVEMPDVPPAEEFKAGARAQPQYENESPFDEQQRELDSGMERLHEKEQDDQTRLDKLERDIKRASRRTRTCCRSNGQRQRNG